MYSECTSTQYFVGPYIHCCDSGELQIVSDGIIGVKDGKITALDVKSNLSKYEQTPSSVQHLTAGQFLAPGLIDTHIHAAQYPNVGVGLDLPLLEWLEKYTFPLEAKFNDVTFAKEVYSKVVRRTLSCGTTTAAYYATIHLEASKILADVVQEYGQRAYVGKVSMDCNAPEYYVEETQQAINDLEEFIIYVKNKKDPLVQPIVTPRFAPVCSLTLQKSLSGLAQKYDLHLQTHLSENRGEIEWVKQLFPIARNYTDVYDRVGMLTPKTVLAHCIYLDSEEIQLLSKRKVGVAHCPISNYNLKSGFCDAKTLLQNGINVGLGTDLSGGHSPSIMEVIRSSLHASNTINVLHQGDYEGLTYMDAFYLATLGGAKALAIDGTVGNFSVGKDFDAIIVDTNIANSPFDTYGTESLQELLQKFLICGDDRNISKVYIRGVQRKVHQTGC